MSVTLFGSGQLTEHGICDLRNSRISTRAAYLACRPASPGGHDEDCDLAESAATVAALSAAPQQAVLTRLDTDRGVPDGVACGGDYMFILTQILIGRDIHLRRLVVLAVLAGVRGGWDRADFIAVPVGALLTCSGASRSNDVAGEGLPTAPISC